MKKIILFISFLIILNGCSNENNDKETVMFLHYFTGNLEQGINELSKAVNSQLKNVNLVATPLEHEEFKVSIRIQLETKNPPDIFSYWAGARTKYLVDKGIVSPIDDLFKENSSIESFDQSIIKACSYNGELYLLPITRHFVGFFYNKKMFREKGIEVPQNWDDLLNVAEILEREGIVPFSLGSKNRWPAQFWFDYILLRTAGYNYREDLMNKASKYTDLEVLKTMDIWKNLIERNYFNTDHQNSSWDEATGKLTSGEAAMTLMGTWAIPYIEDKGLSFQEDYGFFPFPIIDDRVEDIALGPIDGILMSQGSNNKELSKEILYYLAQPDTQEAFNVKSGAIAPHNGVKDSVYSPIQLEIKNLIKKSSLWAFNYDLATEPITSEAGLNFFVDFLNDPDNYEKLLMELQKNISK